MYSERNQGIDLLRILCMYMVVLLHILGQGGILKGTEPLSLNYGMSWLLEIASYCAVNCYALVSGYINVNKQPKPRNIICLWMQVFFYSTSITFLFLIFNPKVVVIKDVIKSFLPIMTSQYWFFTAYFFLFLFMPIINSAIKNLQKNTIKRIIWLMILFLSVFPTLLMRDTFLTKGGYSGIWLIFMYILGAYIKKYCILNEKCINKALVMYLLCVCITWGSKLIIEYLTLLYFGEIKLGNYLVSYTSPTIILSALSLLILFSQIRVPQYMIKIIKQLSPLSFGVYLIHVHPLIWNNVLYSRFEYLSSSSMGMLIISIVFYSFVIYLLCILIDKFRLSLFKLIRCDVIIAFLEKKYGRLNI